MSAPDILIEPCSAAQRAQALRRLHAGLSTDQQTAFPAALDSVRSQGDDAFAGLFVAKSGQEIEEGVWVQLAPGRTAVLWPPSVGGAASAQLMKQAAEFIDQRQVPLTQMLISPQAPQDEKLLGLGGFQVLADLVYLTLESTQFPELVPDESLKFVPGASDHPERLGTVLLDSYEQTQDCPEVNNLRRVEDILASYQSQGDFSPERWFLIQHDDRDVGVLLLTEYATNRTWELIYMGVVPGARGQQFGQRILQFAISQAKQAHAERLVLAADERNAPALALYQAAGMVSWDRRRVYARMRPELEK